MQSALDRAANIGDGATLLDPHDQAGREAMAAVVAQCRNRHSEPLTEEFALDTLAEEHTDARDVYQAYPGGEFLVRLERRRHPRPAPRAQSQHTAT